MKISKLWALYYVIIAAAAALLITSCSVIKKIKSSEKVDSVAVHKVDSVAIVYKDSAATKETTSTDEDEMTIEFENGVIDTVSIADVRKGTITGIVKKITIKSKKTDTVKDSTGKKEVSNVAVKKDDYVAVKKESKEKAVQSFRPSVWLWLILIAIIVYWAWRKYRQPIL